jgi:hypothetical protein
MNQEDKNALLTLIATEQKDTAPVTLTIGKVDSDHQVQHETIVLKEACPHIINRLWEEGYTLDLTADGLEVVGLWGKRK